VTRRLLDGLTVGMTADRRSDEQAELLSNQGARVIHGPTIRTLPLDDEGPTRAATDALIALPPDVVIANTGIGVRAWMAMAESWGVADDLVVSLRSARVLARGPKAAGALAQAGVACEWQSASARMNDVVAWVRAVGAGGLRVALQLDGSGRGGAAAEQLRSAGAQVVEVPTYRWTLPPDTSAALRLIEAVTGGRVHAVTFTAAPALENLFAIARGAGGGDALLGAFNSNTVAMCVGPACRETAASMGIIDAHEPKRARVGAMVMALGQRLGELASTISIGAISVKVQGNAVVSGTDTVLLADKERDVLEVLARRPGVVVPKTALLNEVWGAGAVDDHALEMTVSRLRKRLDPTGLRITAVPRRGYRLSEITPALRP
jgi:uroporphyrinogen-III synthase